MHRSFCRTDTALARMALLLASCSVLPAVASVAIPQDVQVTIGARNSSTNPGPFSAGSGALFDASFRIDGSVTPTGAIPTFAGALDDLVIRITDQTLGSFTILAQNGRLQHIVLGGGTDSMSGGWGNFNGGSIAPFSVTNIGLSATPFVLESISFEFRGAHLYDSPQLLPTSLSHAVAPGSSDFSFLDLTLRFSNSDTNVGGIPKSSIIRTAAFDTVTVSAVPEPATLSMLLAGLLLIGTIAGRRVAR